MPVRTISGPPMTATVRMPSRARPSTDAPAARTRPRDDHDVRDGRADLGERPCPRPIPRCPSRARTRARPRARGSRRSRPTAMIKRGAGVLHARGGSPVAARATRYAGAPSALMRRYVTAYGWTRADAPIASTIHGARARHRGPGARSPSPSREPHAVDAELGGAAPVAGTDLAGDRRGRGVGEEVEQRVRRRQHDPGDREPRRAAGCRAARRSRCRPGRRAARPPARRTRAGRGARSPGRGGSCARAA